MDDWNTRQTLILRVKDANDQEAWHDFVNYYEKFIKIVIYKVCGKSEKQEDMLQNVLLSLWKVLPKFDHDANKAKFRTWLSRIVHNKVIDEMRKENRQKKLKDTLYHEDTKHSNEMEAMIRQEWELNISRMALDNISERFSGKAIEVFKLSLKGHPSDEIANNLDISVDSVYTLRNRVKKYLVKEIKNLRYILEDE